MIIWWLKHVGVILSVLVCEIWINVLLQTSALVGPLYNHSTFSSSPICSTTVNLQHVVTHWNFYYILEMIRRLKIVLCNYALPDDGPVRPKPCRGVILKHTCNSNNLCAFVGLHCDNIWEHHSQPLHADDTYQWPLLTYLLTYSMEQSPSWEANWFCS
jgi:hypothetical protein